MLLDVEHISVAYGGALAISDVNLHVHAGECVGIVGASGSGKSTLAKAVLHLLGPDGRITAGSIAFDGRDITHAKPSEMRSIRGSHVGVIFQNAEASFSPVRTFGTQFLEMMQQNAVSGRGVAGAAPNTNAADSTMDRGMTNAETDRILIDLLSNLGLSDGKRILKSYPFELSGGMCQRVAIAFTLALRPDLIIADEPTSALDVASQMNVVSELMEAQKRYKMAMVLISHNIGLIGHCCRSIAVMHNGRIVEQGTTADVLTHPQNAYTRKLISAVPSFTERK